nr:MAG TPA: hypothetical protein [Bacteriophage sp.]
MFIIKFLLGLNTGFQLVFAILNVYNFQQIIIYKMFTIMLFLYNQINHSG